jgi:hypothetical protein
VRSGGRNDSPVASDLLFLGGVSVLGFTGIVGSAIFVDYVIRRGLDEFIIPDCCAFHSGGATGFRALPTVLWRRKNDCRGGTGSRA